VTVSQRSPVHVAVLAKAPRAGFVKTRLCPPFTLPQAAELAAAALADTLETVSHAVADGLVSRAFIVLDGDPALIAVPPDWAVLAQSAGSLDQRLATAFGDVYRIAPAPILLIGMDTPQLTMMDITAACEALSRDGVDAVIGLATDGGFWALGLGRPDERLLLGIPMSTASTGRAQIERLLAHGLNVVTLDEMCDADDETSAQVVAAAAPDSRFARRLACFAAGIAS
jgi:glycosyltransferase A (GT-A) superfamily protein (DUF2064 family)